VSTPALLLDYLFVRPLIVARLAQQVSVFAQPGSVKGVEELADAIERGVSAPTAFVFFAGDVFDTSEQGRASNGRSQIVQQQWCVVLVVRNADQIDGAARDTLAGPLMSTIHKALAGWVPDGSARPFVRVPGARATYNKNVAAYPLTFGLSLNL
jgi:hypothetical protein